MALNPDFFERVYAVVCDIPRGKVTTYGAIAAKLGAKSSSRMVGYALNNVAGSVEIPCHRVVNRKGELSGRAHFAGDSMRQLLIQEGIHFIEPFTVDLPSHFWNP